MGRPNKFDGLLEEICVTWGFCGSTKHVTHYIPDHGQVTANQFATWVLLAEEFTKPFPNHWMQNLAYALANTWVRTL